MQSQTPLIEISFRPLQSLSPGEGPAGASPRNAHTPRTIHTPRTPKKYTVSPQIKQLNIVDTLRQFSISTPRSLSSRTPRVEIARLIEDSPCEQAVRVVADICEKQKRMSGPPRAEFHYTDLTEVSSSSVNKTLASNAAAAANAAVAAAAAAAASVTSEIQKPMRAVVLSRNSFPSPCTSNEIAEVRLSDSTPRAAQAERVAQEAWNLEFMLESKSLKIETKVQELLSLEIPLKAEELRRVLRELSMKKGALANNPSIKYPAAFRVQTSGGGGILQVHNKKKIYMYFPAKTISEGEFKTVYNGWSVTHKIKRVAIAIAKLSKSPRGILAASVAAANEEKYLKKFNNKTHFVKLLDAFYFPDNKQVLVMKWYPMDGLDVVNLHISRTTPASYKYSLLQKLKLIINIFEGIQYMQQRANVVHRDIKPDNYLIDDKGIRLTDFGFTTDASNIAELNQFKGSYPYVPFEMLKGELYQDGFAQDNWGAACIAYLLLAEHAYPWHKYLVPTNIDKPKAVEAIMKFHQEVPPLSQPLSRLFWEMFHPCPTERPPVHEIIERLNSIVHDIQTPAVLPSAPAAANEREDPEPRLQGQISAPSPAAPKAYPQSRVSNTEHHHHHHHRGHKSSKHKSKAEKKKQI